MTNKLTVQQTKSGLACTGKDKDKPDLTINNFLIVMLSDAKYVGVKFNELRGVGEWHRIDKNGKLIIRAWTDADEAESERSSQIMWYGASTNWKSTVAFGTAVFEN